MVRYADKPTVEVSTEIDAPPAAVWVHVVDPSTPAAFSREFQGADWLGDGPGPGARFRGRNRHPTAGEWTTECIVTGFEPEREFAWHVMDTENPVAIWRFRLEPLDGGRTRLTQWAQMGPGPSGLTPAIEAMPDREEQIVARRLDEWRTNMQATVDGIKGLAEGRG